MDPNSVIDDAEFWLPSEFLTDDDFLVDKENHGDRIDGFELKSGFGSSVKPIGGDKGDFLAGLTKQMLQSSLEDDFSGYQAFPVKNETKACVAGIGCACRNQRSRVASPAASWDLYCSTAEEMARKNNITTGKTSAVKNPSSGTGYFSQQHSLQYQKLQALQFQQLKQQQLRHLVQQRVHNTNKNGGPAPLPPAWSNQVPRRDGSGMRAVFIGNQTGKRTSTGTGVFLPRRVNQNTTSSSPVSSKSTISTVLVPARVAQVLNLNLDESMVQPNLNDVTWRQRSNNGGYSSEMKAEQPGYEALLPADWAY